MNGWINIVKLPNDKKVMTIKTKQRETDWYFENIFKNNMEKFDEYYYGFREQCKDEKLKNLMTQLLKQSEINQAWQEEKKDIQERELLETHDGIKMRHLSKDEMTLIKQRVNTRLHGKTIHLVKGWTKKSRFESDGIDDEGEAKQYEETSVPPSYGDYKINAIANLFEYFENNYPESNPEYAIQEFDGMNEATKTKLKNGILDGDYPSEAYLGFTFTYNGKPCGIFDNIGDDPGSGRFAVCGEPGDDACELLFKDSKSGALYRGQADNKTIRFNHKDPEHIDESLRKLDLRTLHWLKNGKRLNSNNGYDTNVDIDNRDRFYSARATISNIEARLESDEDLDQQTMDELNKTLNNARKILDKAQEEKQKAYDNLFI